MKIWLDAHLSPDLTEWMSTTFAMEVESLIARGLEGLKDRQFFDLAREAGAVIMTNDSDFLDVLDRHGAPPQIIYLVCGNTSNAELRRLLSASLPSALRMLAAGESLVEIGAEIS